MLQEIPTQKVIDSTGLNLLAGQIKAQQDAAEFLLLSTNVAYLGIELDYKLRNEQTASETQEVS